MKQFFPLGDDWSLLFGVSAANGPNAASLDARTDVFGVDVYLKYRPVSEASPPVVSLQAEWLYRKRHVAGDVLHDTGGYAQLLWRFLPRWGAAARYEFATPALSGGRPVVSWTCTSERLGSHQAAVCRSACRSSNFRPLSRFFSMY